MPAWNVLAELMKIMFKSSVGESAVRGHRNENDDHAEVSNEVTSLMINVEVKIINEWRPTQFK